MFSINHTGKVQVELDTNVNRFLRGFQAMSHYFFFLSVVGLFPDAGGIEVLCCWL